MGHKKPLILSDVWRTCNKVRAAIFRGGVDLWAHYKPLDPNNNSLISESKFVSVLNGPLKDAIGLSEQEIIELTDYFRVSDGRIIYTQFCQVIHDSVPDFSRNKPLVTGLEWEDPFHCNVLSVSEERRLQLLLTKIAALVNLRRLVLRPYFQDYELIAKNTGVVTFAHFARVLNHLNILLSADDFQLLVKKFIKDSYTLNYVAFVQAVDLITKYMDEKCMLDVGGDVLLHYPGKAISAELPKLPRPEIGRIRAATVFGKQSIFHPVLEATPEIAALHVVMRRVQRHVLVSRMQTGQFFKDFDPMHSGRVTVSQFRRCLDGIGLGGIDRLYIAEPELAMILRFYADPNDPDRICYATFVDDVDQVFTTKCLELMPDYQVVAPPREVLELPRLGGNEWQTVNTETRDLCEETMMKVKTRCRNRGIILKPAFGAYDSHNNGHVSRGQFRQCLSCNALLLSDEELYALEQRFNDDLGFNYFWLFRELDTKSFEEPLYTGYVMKMNEVNAEARAREATAREVDIVEILARLKGEVVRKRLRPQNFLEDYDRHNEQVVTRDDFVRGLDCCRFRLTQHELCTIMDVFASPMRPGWVEYRRFCAVLEEAFTQACLERAPLVTPLQHLVVYDGDVNFLDFDERHTLSMAMTKLAARPNMNLESLFQDFDRQHCGLVTSLQFQKALTVRDMNTWISSREMDVVLKCFSVERPGGEDVNYRGFLRALELVALSNIKKPF